MSSLAISPVREANRSSPGGLSVPCTLILAEPELVIPASAHTLAGFRAWAKSNAFPERGRFSFLGEEIFIDMSPEEIETHGKVKGEVSYGIIGLNKKRKLGHFYPDRTLVTNEEANLSTEPDGTFVLWESLESGRVRLIPREDAEGQYLEVEGTPDWVLEIVSKTSVRKDTRLLRQQYHRASIPEYWLIDARDEDIDFQILVREEADYVAAPIERGGWQWSPVFGRLFRLTRRRDRLGYWEYTLQVKARR
jgi:Uma2 family endonuclease